MLIRDTGEGGLYLFLANMVLWILFARCAYCKLILLVGFLLSLTWNTNCYDCDNSRCIMADVNISSSYVDAHEINMDIHGLDEIRKIKNKGTNMKSRCLLFLYSYGLCLHTI